MSAWFDTVDGPIPSRVSNIHGDITNEILRWLRQNGYEDVHVGGTRTGVLLYAAVWEDSTDYWDARLGGAPCAGDGPDCYGFAPKGDYLCHRCRCR